MLRVAAPLIALALAGCSAAPPGGSLAVAVAGEDAAATAMANQLAAEASEATLITRAANGALAPGLATSWRFLDSGSDLILRLAPVRWPAPGATKGRELAARDVVASLQRSPRRYRSDLAAAGLARRGTARAPIARVVELSPRPATPHLLDWLAEPALAVRGRRGQAFPGPYAASKADGGWQLTRRSDLPGPSARAAAISIKPMPVDAAIADFAAGRLPLVVGAGLSGLGAARASGQGRAVRIEAVTGVIGLAIRPNGALADPRLRRAVLLAADGAPLANRLALAALVPQNRLWPGLPEPGDGRAQPRTDRQAEAAGLLAAAGFGAEQPLRLVLLVPPAADWQQLAQALATSLQPIGIELVLMTASKAQVRHDLALQEHVARVPDVLAFLAQWRCGRAQPCSAAADQQLAQAAETGNDLPRRLALAAAVEQEMLRDPAFVPLLRPVRWALVSRRISGFEANMLGRHPVARIASED
jgi:oligopeptide transport system substrate-binding protein